MICSLVDCAAEATTTVLVHDDPKNGWQPLCREHADWFIELLLATRLDHSIAAVVK